MFEKLKIESAPPIKQPTKCRYDAQIGKPIHYLTSGKRSLTHNKQKSNRPSNNDELIFHRLVTNKWRADRKVDWPWWLHLSPTVFAVCRAALLHGSLVWISVSHQSRALQRNESWAAVNRVLSNAFNGCCSMPASGSSKMSNTSCINHLIVVWQRRAP